MLIKHKKCGGLRKSSYLCMLFSRLSKFQFLFYHFYLTNGNKNCWSRFAQNKRGEIALTYIYGIGRSSSAKILDKAGVSRDLKVNEWTDDQAAKIREIIGAEFKVEGDLRSEIQMNIKRLMDIGCYRGIRHRIGLPVRGQSTKNNSRTRKGKKKTVANKKKATK